MTSEDRSDATYALAGKSQIEAWPQRLFFSVNKKKTKQTNKKIPLKHKDDRKELNYI